MPDDRKPEVKIPKILGWARRQEDLEGFTKGKMTDGLMADDRHEDPEDSRFTTTARRSRRFHEGKDDRHEDPEDSGLATQARGHGGNSKIPAKIPKISDSPRRHEDHEGSTAGRMADDRMTDGRSEDWRLVVKHHRRAA